MKDRITEIVTSHWEARRPALMQLVADRTRQVENLLVLEDFHRSGRKGEALQKAMGQFGSSALDMSSLSSVLQQSEGASAMERERFDRVQNMYAELQRLGQNLDQDPPECSFLDLGGDAAAVLEAFDAHVSPMAKVFRYLRIAQIEARAKYEPEEHDPFFENFNWRHLDNSEMALCPPFVVLCQPGAEMGEFLGRLLELVTSGRPVKVVVLRDRLDNELSETGRAAALKSASNLELLFISLRNVYFLQSSRAGQQPLDELLAHGLDSPRPGVFSIYAGEGVRDNGGLRAGQALNSRAFPHMVYDPDQAADFVSCLDLSHNPALEEVWPKAGLEYVNDDGEDAQLERQLTFADFALGENALAGHFSPVNGDLADDEALPLTDYLERHPDERRGKVPFIYSVDSEKRLVRLEPSQSIVAQTADRMHLWHTLQELGGIRNPFVMAAEQETMARLTEEKQQSLLEQKTQLEARIAEREQTAVASAMRNLAMRLTGQIPLESGGIAAPGVPQPTGALPEGQPLPDVAPEAPAAPAEAEEAPAEISETPWVEAALCTTCDECIDINKKIFAYNSDKKAIIKDPRGGPFKDIVRAAEKCSSGAIHPGKPLDPNEKDLEKWIKRAEPFQ